ncbi:serine/threonine-protein kinase [Spirillospora sp. CA-294931]|uniref:serine/threonine-protein kinase n=1 Tax=Spirillospora sp. CA-294931 TaxID=3240042 RepID=UPI003D9350E2
MEVRSMAEALPLQPGDPQRLGDHEVSGRLGVGEQGSVFLGRDPSGADVAIKLLHVRLSGEPAARSRFAGALADARKVSGFHTAAILSADVTGDRPYVVTELVVGPTLQQLVDDEGPRGAMVLERLAVGTGIALAAIHRAGAVHHTYKPANVLLGKDGPRVSDFGIARALEAVNAAPAGRVSDDPAYQAPEQLSGVGIGAPADVFAWATTLLFAATGKPPFGDDSPSGVMQRIVYDDPDLTALPESLREVVEAALSKDPLLRPTGRELLERLVGEGGPLAARTPEPMLREARALTTDPPGRAPEPAPAPTPTPDELYAPPSLPPPPQAVLTPTSISPPPPPPPAQPQAGRLLEEADEATQSFAPVPARPSGPAEVTGPTHIIPGMRVTEPEDERDSTAVLSVPAIRSRASGLRGGLAGIRLSGPGSVRSRFRSSRQMLGVALSLGIGVVVGIAIIALVLGPLGDDDDDPGPGPGNAGNQPVQTIPADFGGTWRGTAVNTGNGGTFPIEVTFEAGKKTARAHYPQNRCQGQLSMTKGTKERLDMSLSVNKPCTNGNVQVIRQPDGTLQYMWNKPGSDIGYQGKLSRN